MRTDMFGGLVVPVSALLFAVLLWLTGGGCASKPTGNDLASGVWAGDGGADTFYWELTQTNDGYTGVIHTVTDGKKQTELPISYVDWQPPHLEMRMAATGVAYRGQVDFGKGHIKGRLFFGDDEGPEMTLLLTDPDQVSGLRPRPATVAYTYQKPVATDDGIATADCQEFGLPHQSVGGLVAAICKGQAGVIHSVLILAQGQLIVEEYFHGYDRDSLHRLASVTKSVSSLLVGRAIDAGKIPSVKAPLLDYFPNLERPSSTCWQTQTLHHVLSMSMGLDWGPDEDFHATGPDFFQAILKRQCRHDPGTHWAYHSANINLLSAVLKQATGQPVEAFTAAEFFDPLGITTYDWSFQAVDDDRLMDGSLHLRPRDMAKLGMLLRNEGKWLGKQVLSSDWIKRSITPQMITDGPEKYGYLWWLGTFTSRKGPQPIVFANGHGSQFIAWLPEQDIVLVITGGNDDNGQHFAILDVLGKHL